MKVVMRDVVVIMALKSQTLPAFTTSPYQRWSRPRSLGRGGSLAREYWGGESWNIPVTDPCSAVIHSYQSLPTDFIQVAWFTQYTFSFSWLMRVFSKTPALTGQNWVYPITNLIPQSCFSKILQLLAVLDDINPMKSSYNCEKLYIIHL